MEDGTKLKMYNNILQPMFPEMVDLKITDFCDMGCSYCHESSSTVGKHASMYNLDSVLKKLVTVPFPMEVAIGGGNPLDSPVLGWLLRKLKEMEHIANITINAGHFKKEKYRDQLKSLQEADLIKGIGISESLTQQEMEWSRELKNVVYHVIVNITDLDYLNIDTQFKKILILGFKHFGRARKFPTQAPGIILWQKKFVELLKKDNIISFDNLAIRQISLRSRMSKKKFDAGYQGKEGEISFYIDAVGMQMCKTSYSPEGKRHNFSEKNFKNWQKIARYS